jgi:hypothetical protein
MVWNFGFNISEKLDQFDRLVQAASGDEWRLRGISYVVEESGLKPTLSTQIVHQNARYRLGKRQS